MKSSTGPSGLLSTECKKFGIRHLQVALLFICMAVSLTVRVNLSVAIVAMIDKESANPSYTEFQWNEQTQSLLLSSFFWGYIVTQVPAGQICEKKGPKFVLLISLFICGLVSIITPICTEHGDWQAMCALRVLTGLCQGVVYPAFQTLLSKWIPKSERGPLATYCYVGGDFGTVIMLGISGILASSVMGWPSIFYFSGTACLLWTALWWWLGSSSPESSRLISDKEKEYILSALSTNENGDVTVKENAKPSTPWLSIFTSMPFLALALTQAGHLWGFWTLMTKTPAYMKNVLKFDLKQNALVSALPYLAKFVMSFAFSFLSQFLDGRKLISTNFSRKFFNSIGQWVPAILLIGFSYVSSDNANLAVALLTIAVAFNAAVYLGFQVNHIDLAPNFAGTMMGITNGVANIFSLVAPLIIGFIVTDETNIYQWRIIYFIAAAIYFLGNLMFVVFGKTDIQRWNEPKTQ